MHEAETETFRVCTESWILEKVSKIARKSGQNFKRSWIFFFYIYKKCLKWIFFLFWSILIQSHPYVGSEPHKKTLFLRFLRCLLITYVITLSLEKEIIIVFEKSLEKSLEFWIQKSVQTLNFALNEMSVQIVPEFHLASQTIHVNSCNKIIKVWES